MRLHKKLAILALAAVVPTLAMASEVEHKSIGTNPIDLHEYLTEFHKNSKKVMNTPLARRDKDGNVVTDSGSPFDPQETSR